MAHQENPDAARVARARALVAAAAIGVERLEDAAHLAFCQLAALTGMLARLEGLGGSQEPDASEAAALDAAMVCREAKVLLRYISSTMAGRPSPCERRSSRRSPAQTGSGTSGRSF